MDDQNFTLCFKLLNMLIGSSSDPMLLAVNANSPFTEPCNGWTKCVCVFGTGKPRVA